MANVENLYSPSDAPDTGFDPIPVGKYVGIIVESEMKDNAAKDGRFLYLTFEILEGPLSGPQDKFKGRKLWDRLNLVNKSAEAVSIAKAKWAAIRHAVNVMQPKDSVEVHNLPLILEVKQRKRDDTGDLVNEIKGYHKKEGSTQASQSQMTQNANAPWKR